MEVTGVLKIIATLELQTKSETIKIRITIFILDYDYWLILQ